MKEDHARVRIGDYEIPLIGVPKSATEYYCDKCHRKCEVEELQLCFNGIEFWCQRCKF